MPTTNTSNYTTLYSTTAGAVAPQQPYGNANVEAFLNVGTDGGNTVQNIVANGTITANGNIESNGYFVGDGGYLTNVSVNVNTANFANFASNVTNSAQPNITSVGTLVNVTVTGNITSTSGVFVGDGGGLTNVSANTSNLANVSNANSLSTNTFYPVFANGTGNVQLNIDNVGTSLNYIPNSGQLAANVFRSEYFTNDITPATGETINLDGSNNLIKLSITGAANAVVISNSLANFSIPITSNGNITSTGGIFNGDGGGLSNINVGNITVNSNFANFAGNVTNSAQPNITSVGTLVGLDMGGNITANANVTYDIGNNTNRFKDIWLSNSTIYLGNANLKSDDSNSTFNVSVTGRANAVVVGNTSANVNTGNLRVGNILISDNNNLGFTATLNTISVPNNNPVANNRSIVLLGSPVDSLANVTDATVTTGGLILNSGGIGNNTVRISSTTQNLSSGQAQLAAGTVFGDNNAGRNVIGGIAILRAGGVVSNVANNANTGQITISAGAATLINANTVNGGQLNSSGAAIAIDSSAANFNIGNVNLGITNHQFSTMSLNRSNGIVGNIRFPLVNFGAAFGTGISIGNGVSNITVNNVTTTDQVYFRTGGVAGLGGVTAGNINNVLFGNVTTQQLRLETGSWVWPTGPNVSNVTVGNLTTGDILFFTGATSNATSVTGTLNRGNIRLNAKNVLIETSNTSNSSFTTFSFSPDGNANLGNFVISNNAIITGNINANNLSLAGNVTSNLNVTGNIFTNNDITGDAFTGNTVTLNYSNDANGRVLFTTTASNVASAKMWNSEVDDPQTQFGITDLRFSRYSNFAGMNNWQVYRTRGTSANRQPVQTGDTLYSQTFDAYGDSGNTFVNGAGIVISVKNNDGAGNVDSNFNINGGGGGSANSNVQFNNFSVAQFNNANIITTNNVRANNANLSGILNIRHNNINQPAIEYTTYNNTTGDNNTLSSFRSRGDALGGPQNVQPGDDVVEISAYGYANGDYRLMAGYTTTTKAVSGNTVDTLTQFNGPPGNYSNSEFRIEYGHANIGGGNINMYSGNGLISTTGRLEYLRTYGGFFNPNDIATTANTVANLELPNTYDANGISIISNNQITIQRTGTYNIQFSLQVKNTDNAADHDIDVWFAKNGTDVANSASQWTVVKNDGKNICVVNFVDTVTTANDYYQIRYAVSSANVSLEAFPNITTPYTRPAIPSAIVTVVPVGA